MCRGMGVSCDLIKQKRKRVSIDGHEDVPPSDEKALRKAVSQQPVSVAICASELQFYGSGEATFICLGRFRLRRLSVSQSGLVVDESNAESSW